MVIDASVVADGAGLLEPIYPIMDGSRSQIRSPRDVAAKAMISRKSTGGIRPMAYR